MADQDDDKKPPVQGKGAQGNDPPPKPNDPPKPADPPPGPQIPDAFKRWGDQATLVWPTLGLPNFSDSYAVQYGFSVNGAPANSAESRRYDVTTGINWAAAYTAKPQTNTFDIFYGGNDRTGAFGLGFGQRGDGFALAAGGKQVDGANTYYGGLSLNTDKDIYSIGGGFADKRFGFDVKGVFDPKGDALTLGAWHAFNTDGRFSFDYQRNFGTDTEALNAKLALDKRNYASFGYTADPKARGFGGEVGVALNDDWALMAAGKFKTDATWESNLGLVGKDLQVKGIYGVGANGPFYGASLAQTLDPDGSKLGANFKLDARNGYSGGIDYTQIFSKQESLKGTFAIEQIQGQKLKFNAGAEYTRDNWTLSGGATMQDGKPGGELKFTFRFGGPSSPVTARREPSLPEPIDAPDRAPRAAPTGDAKALSDTTAALRTRSEHGQQLFAQAKEQVETLNRKLPAGGQLPLFETAGSLAALAEKGGFSRIGYAAVGTSANGQQNVFIGQEASVTARTLASERLSIDAKRAGETPVLDSIGALAPQGRAQPQASATPEVRTQAAPEPENPQVQRR